VHEPRLPLRARYALFFALDEPRFPLRVRYALFIALTLVGVGIAYVIDVGHIMALAPSVALGLIAEYGREELVLRAGRPSPDASGAAEHGDGRAPGLREDAAVEDDGGMSAVRASFLVSATEAVRSRPELGGSARAQPYRGQEYEGGGDFGR